MALAKREILASVRGLEDRFVTHIALVLSGAAETRWVDVATVVIVAVSVKVRAVEPDDIWFEQLLLIVYMYLSTLPLLPLSSFG